MKNTIIILISIVFINTSCQNIANKNSAQQGQSKTGEEIIPYAIAKNYFVKNNVTSIVEPKIETEEKFNEIFGMATTMGENGKPTTINFSKQYVIAIMIPESDLQPHIEPVSLIKNEKGEVVFTYKIVNGQKQSYTTVANIAIIVDRSYDGPITLIEQKVL